MRIMPYVMVMCEFLVATTIVFLAMTFTMSAQAWAQGVAHSDAGALADAMQKVVSGEASAVIILSAIGVVMWRAWRDDTLKNREHAERMASVIERSNAEFAHAISDVARALDRQTEAVTSMKKAVEDLDRSIRDRAPARA